MHPTPISHQTFPDGSIPPSANCQILCSASGPQLVHVERTAYMYIRLYNFMTMQVNLTMYSLSKSWQNPNYKRLNAKLYNCHLIVSNLTYNNSPNAEITIPAVRNIAVSFMTLRWKKRMLLAKKKNKFYCVITNEIPILTPFS